MQSLLFENSGYKNLEHIHSNKTLKNRINIFIMRQNTDEKSKL